MKSLDGLHPTLMRPRVEALLNDPEAKKLGLYLVSGYRSVARQAVLFAAAVVRYGSVAKARRWVAPPGKSNHGPRVDGFGTAVDLGLPGVKAVSGQWPPDIERKVAFLAAKHGLYSPLEWEDWHHEPIKNWDQPTEDLTIVDAETKKYLDDQFALLRHEVDNVQEAVAGRVPGDPKKRSLIGRIADSLKVKP